MAKPRGGFSAGTHTAQWPPFLAPGGATAAGRQFTQQRRLAAAEHPVTTTAIADGPGTRRMPFFKVLPVLAHGREAHSLVKIREIL